MNPIHMEYDVKHLNKTLDFYKDILNAKIKYLNSDKKIACIQVHGVELELMESKNFQGYLESQFDSRSIGIEVEDHFKVNEVFVRAMGSDVPFTFKPFDQYEGHYTLYLKDPDGMNVEVYSENHE